MSGASFIPAIISFNPFDCDALQAQNRVKDHVDPENRVHGGHHEEGRDQEHPNDPAARKGLVDQDGDQHAEDHGQEQDRADDQQAVLDGKPGSPCCSERSCSCRNRASCSMEGVVHSGRRRLFST